MRVEFEARPSARNISQNQVSPIASPLPSIELRQERSLQLALAAARTAEDNRGEDVAVLDMRSITPEFDYFVLATGNSRRQLHAISEEIDRTLADDLGDRRLGIEGYSDSRWILLDYGSVVIHLFDAERRTFYALEDLWGTAERVRLPWQTPRSGDTETGTLGDG
jgi:ribosome-associated protein